MQIWISGAAGRMGRAVAAQAAEENIGVFGGVDQAMAALPFPCYPSFDEAPVGGDVIIDFSQPSALSSVLSYACRNRLPLVLATTGYSAVQQAEIQRAAAQVPVFQSANMSIGVAVLRRLARQAAQMLGESFDIEIVEAHHNKKADAPSGTALMLLKAVCDAGETEKKPVYGRSGRHLRTPDEIGVHALRGGTVAGEHQVCFFGPSERIVLSHSAEQRSVFAVGALRAAAFLLGKGPGLYDMDDLLAEG